MGINSVTKAALVVAALGLGSQASAANLVTNGSFETGDFTGWTQVGNTGLLGSVLLLTGELVSQMEPTLLTSGRLIASVASPRTSPPLLGTTTTFLLIYIILAVHRASTKCSSVVTP